jgi:hypothetical protein
MPVETSRAQNGDIKVLRDVWSGVEIGITYSLSGDRKELTVRSADTHNGWNPEITYSYTVTLYNAEGEKITETGDFTVGDKLKGDILPLSVRYDPHTLSLQWNRLANAEVYDVYVKEKDRSDYVQISSVEDRGDAMSTVQTSHLFYSLYSASKPVGIYYAKVIGRNALTKGDLATASETEVNYNLEFPLIRGLHYDPATYILSWEKAAIDISDYLVYFKKEGEKEYREIYDIYFQSGETDIIRHIWNAAYSFGTYQVKVTGNNSYQGTTGNLEKATPITIEYPNITLPPITKVSLKDRTITWEVTDQECPVFCMYAKEAGKDDSEYKPAYTIENKTDQTKFDIDVHHFLLYNSIFGSPNPVGTYTFKGIVYDKWHNWSGALEEAIPMTYEFDGKHMEN